MIFCSNQGVKVWLVHIAQLFPAGRQFISSKTTKKVVHCFCKVGFLTMSAWILILNFGIIPYHCKAITKWYGCMLIPFKTVAPSWNQCSSRGGTSAIFAHGNYRFQILHHLSNCHWDEWECQWNGLLGFSWWKLTAWHWRWQLILKGYFTQK